MFVEDIEIFSSIQTEFQEGIIHKQFASRKLAQRQQMALEKINKPISIRDLVVRINPEVAKINIDYCLGETMHENQYQESDMKRLNAHIGSLFRLANEDHRANYCERDNEGNFQIKKGMENHITRLSMSEFSLYTNNPLKMSEFQNLIGNVEKMAEALEPNVYALLSSFAVRDTYNQLLNLSVFVEGGNPPTLHVFAKNTASISDVDYRRSYIPFSQDSKGENFSQHASQIVTGKDELTSSVSTGSVFDITTQGGACFTQAIDVCIDHGYGHSKTLITRRIAKETPSNEILPDQVEQCVTSCGTDILSENTIASKVLQADPFIPVQAPIEEQRLSAEALERALVSEFDNEMQVVPNSTGYRIDNPVFGPCDYFVEVFKERPAARYKPELQASISEHNQEVHKRQLMAAGQPVAPLIKNILSQRITALEQTMLKRCTSGIWQKIFKTEEHWQKIRAAEIISNSFKMIKQCIEQHGNDSMHMIHAWKKDLNLRLHLIATSNIHSPLAVAFSKDIREYIDDKLQKDLGVEFDNQERGPEP